MAMSLRSEYRPSDFPKLLVGASGDSAGRMEPS